MKMNKFILVLIFCLTLMVISVNGAETLNFVSVSASGNTNLPSSPNGYYIESYPAFSGAFGNSSNASIFCTATEADFNDCRRASDGAGYNLSSCTYYNIANTSTSPIVTNVNSQLLTTGFSTVYCQVCTSDGSCDNTTSTGDNAVTIFSANLTTSQSVILPVGIIAYLGILVSIGVSLSKSKKLTKDKLQELFVAGIIGVMAMVLLYIAMV